MTSTKKYRMPWTKLRKYWEKNKNEVVGRSRHPCDCPISSGIAKIYNKEQVLTNTFRIEINGVRALLSKKAKEFIDAVDKNSFNSPAYGRHCLEIYGRDCLKVLDKLEGKK